MFAKHAYTTCHDLSNKQYSWLHHGYPFLLCAIAVGQTFRMLDDSGIREFLAIDINKYSTYIAQWYTGV